jgi:cardiolipin synthase
MKKNLITSLFALITLTQSVLAKPSSPEVLHLDRNKVSTFLLSNSTHEGIVELKNSMGDISAEISCDGVVKLKKKSIFSRNLEGSHFNFKLKDKKQAYLYVPKEVNNCELKFSDNSSIKLIKDEVAFPLLKNFNNIIENCSYKQNSKEILPIEELFLSNQYPMMTCAHSTEKIEIVEDSEESLLVKMEALLGYRPSVDFIRNQNPYAELDFSKAPKLDAIFIATLLYRHDFTGATIARLLKFHAQRGTLINILATGYMHEQKDKALLKELSQLGPNVRVQEYKYIDNYSGPKLPMTYLDNYLRDVHVKMFITLSNAQPENNVIITGGRNIHDGFVFSTKPDLSKYPELSQSPEGAYAFWNDLEIKINSTELAKSIYGHLLKLWNRKIKGQKTEAISIAKDSVDGSDVLNSQVPMMRHFLSLPFNDDQSLEKLYVEMIDKASISIKLSSPYLRPTKAIMKAFERAIQRGVDITIQTRINLAGDTAAWLYEETNKSAINALFEKVKIYEWTEESILHTKMILIDNKFAFFGSVNLSRRSFIQDVESGLLIHDENFVGKLTNIFEEYNNRSRQIQTEQKKKFFASLLVLILQNQF